MKRVMPIARRQYRSCLTVRRSGMAHPAGIQPSGQDERLFRLCRVRSAAMTTFEQYLETET